MTNEDAQIVGKAVKDMYGTSMGKVIGTITDIDGTIQTVGVDCGSQGLQQVPFDQIVVQGSVVIFIPKWRLDSQRLLREKGLTLRRLKALSEILSENDEMRDDAAIVDGRYREQLDKFSGTEAEIARTLSARVEELDAQLRSVKMIVFDARVQYKSDEIAEAAFEAVKAHTSDLVEHITHENAEISSVQRRIADLNMEVKQVLEAHDARLQDSAMTYLGDHTVTAAANLPEAPVQAPLPDGGSAEAGGQASADPADVGAQFPEPPLEIAAAPVAAAEAPADPAAQLEVGAAPQVAAEAAGASGEALAYAAAAAAAAAAAPPPLSQPQPAQRQEQRQPQQQQQQPAVLATAAAQGGGGAAQAANAGQQQRQQPTSKPDWLSRMQSQ